MVVQNGGAQLDTVMFADIAHLSHNSRALSVITARNLDPHSFFTATRNGLKALAASDLSRSNLV